MNFEISIGYATATDAEIVEACASVAQGFGSEGDWLIQEVGNDYDYLEIVNKYEENGKLIVEFKKVE